VQTLIVMVIVAAAAIAASWQMMPRIMRRWLIRRMTALAPSQRGLLAQLEAKAENSACGSCRGCSYTSGQAAAPPQVTPDAISLARRSRGSK
jgi:hypothetical protein